MAATENTAKSFTRKPLRNFIFLPKVQWPQIVGNMALAGFTALGTGAAILYLYHREFGESSIYVMDRSSILFPLDRRGLLDLLLPAVGATTLMGMFLGWLMAFGASRRIALPIYKVEQWARRISSGDLHVRVGFRKADHLDELANACNGALDKVREDFLEIRSLVADEKIPKEVRDRLGDILSRYRSEKA
jgi:methyl-accepting chemotaxis protein